MIKYLIIIGLLLSHINLLNAQQLPEEGVYPLKMIPALPLKSSGLTIEPSAIHNNSGTGLTSSLVDFGGYTGAFLSNNGILITTSNEKTNAAKLRSFSKTDSLSQYFYAADKKQEAEAKGLTCTITDPYGNTMTILDLRFVYFPITDATKTDNGAKDFILLRAYVSPEGRPTSYAPTNVPFTPTKILAIDGNGAGMDDFIFSLGFSKAKRYQTKDEVMALDKQKNLDQWFNGLYSNSALLRISKQTNDFKSALDKQPLSKKESYFLQHIEEFKRSLLSDYQKMQLDRERSDLIRQLNSVNTLGPGTTVDAVQKITDRSTDISSAINEFVNDAWGFTKLKDQKYVFGNLLKSSRTLSMYNDGLLVFENDISKQLNNTKTERENTYQLGLQNSRLLFTFGKISNPPVAFSGSPVMNAKGELVGIINNKLNMVDVRTIAGVLGGLENGQSLLEN